MAEQRAALDALQSSWQEALARFEQLRGNLQLEAERGVLELAVKLGERVARRSIVGDEQAAVRQLAGAIEMAMSPSRLRVRVSPADARAVREALPSLTDRMHESPSVSVVEDDTLSRGSVMIEADETTVDATIETQLARIVEALLPDGRADGGAAP